jgi:hypothetical protein
MEIRVLRYFLTVVREENILKAADVLHITQPTLSRHLSTNSAVLVQQGYAYAVVIDVME